MEHLRNNSETSISLDLLVLLLAIRLRQISTKEPPAELLSFSTSSLVSVTFVILHYCI
jgi:hypothetical protein